MSITRSLFSKRVFLVNLVLIGIMIGFVAAFFAALACVRWFLRYVSDNDFRLFAWYRIVFGGVILLTAYADTQAAIDSINAIGLDYYLMKPWDPPEQNLWQHFIRYDQVAPGMAQCGNVHFAPNSERDYDWGNRRPVLSGCDDWLHFPDLSGRRRMVDCREWGNGDMRRHHLWWLQHLPRAAGSTYGVRNNWWAYIVDPNLVES